MPGGFPYNLAEVFGISTRRAKEQRPYLKGQCHTGSLNVKMQPFVHFGAHFKHIKMMCRAKEPRPYLKGQGLTCSFSVCILAFVAGL